jgi:phage baseplate assembly protein W
MAVVLGQKVVKDTVEFNDYAIGISLPIQIGNVAFNQTFQTIDQVKSNIKNLLLTKRGERIMQPEFGSGLQEVLFEFNDDDLSQRIEETITTAIDRYIPSVSIESIVVESTDALKDSNQVNISLTFRVIGNQNVQNVTFNVNG